VDQQFTKHIGSGKVHPNEEHSERIYHKTVAKGVSRSWTNGHRMALPIQLSKTMGWDLIYQQQSSNMDDSSFTIEEQGLAGSRMSQRMDLGSSVCTKSAPPVLAAQVSRWCAGVQQNLTNNPHSSQF
jgi:hypothetical protein